MRAFFAIPVPEPVGRELLGLVPPVKGMRRGRPDRLHLTLHFLADAPDDLADRVRFTGLPKAFTLTPGKVILLPRSGPVQVVAASVTGEGLHELHARVADSLRQLALPVESRPFLPHITLARCSPPLPQQVRGQTPMAPRSDVSFPVRSFQLVESVLRSGSVDHTARQTWTLPD